MALPVVADMEAVDMVANLKDIALVVDTANKVVEAAMALKVVMVNNKADTEVLKVPTGLKVALNTELVKELAHMVLSLLQAAHMVLAEATPKVAMVADNSNTVVEEEVPTEREQEMTNENLAQIFKFFFLFSPGRTSHFPIVPLSDSTQLYALDSTPKDSL
jgi:hypothetical protein